MPNSPKSQSVPEAFIPPHMKDAQEQVQRGLPGAQADSARDADDPKMQEEYAFDFDWTDRRGRRWHGPFRNRIASIYQKRLIGLTRGRALAGVPLSSVDIETQALIQMVAWMQTTLVERPKWFEDPDRLTDDRLVDAVFAEVASHERTFHKLDQPEEAGPEAG